MTLVGGGRLRSTSSERLRCVLMVTILVVAVGVVRVAFAPTAAAAGGPCGPPVTSVIACENTLLGDPASDWQVTGVGDATIQGYATAMSVNLGNTVSFKISTPALSYHLDILRMGYYQGNGARKVVSGLRPTATLPQTQPACATDATSGLVDCGNWAVSASWTVPTNAVSGVYLAHLVRDDTGGSSLIPFVVRNDASTSGLVFQTSDETWQAYNTYGGNSLYQCTVACPPGNPGGYKAAYKVSYNRPFHTALDDQGRSSVMYTEYPMIRFMEANGYDVSYLSGLDTATRGPLLLNHKTFMSVGHDEYWSGDQRANVEAARDHGVNLAFFSGNEVFWKTRWEPSIAGGATAGRTLVSYKETHFDAPADPQDPPTWTGTWRDPRFSPPADGGRPENALTGQFFIVNAGTSDITVPAQYSKMRLWRNTAVANLTTGQSVTLGSGIGTLGYEWDEDADNGSRPAGLFDLSSTTVTGAQVFADYGTNVTTGNATHHLTLYRAASGALVFGAGTVQWSWGLDGATTGKAPDVNMQQATVNLFADMGAQPATPISGIQAATASTDTVAPTSTITSPAPSTSVPDGTAVTISGAATDSGGTVAGVEVSTDGGSTWHPASGTTSWTYSWIAHGAPTITIKTRAVDDSGNLEVASVGTAVAVTCPCSLWGTNATPTGAIDSGDGSSIEVGVKFTADTFGTVSGLRFYKASANNGTHVGNLWTVSGQLLARATFTGETASGWQSVTFAQPVPITSGTTYVASYYAPVGHYSEAGGYFYPHPAPEPDGNDSVDSAPLHALRNTGGTANALYSYSGSTTFPTSTYSAENYWVDPVFSPAPAPGQVTNVVGTVGYASAGVSWSAPSTGGAVTTYTVTPYIGSTAQTPIAVTGSPTPTSAVVTGLTNGTTYTFTVTASNPNGSGPASSPSNSVTPSTAASLIQNGGFESGLTAWTSSGIIPPAANTSTVHNGTGSALLGLLSGAGPAGDSSVSQTITVPPTGTTTLSFWYRPASADATCSGTSCVYDWQEAQVRTPAGATLTSIFKSNSNSQTWTQVTANLTAYAGQTIVLWFNVHQDSSTPPDDTSIYLDDVSVTGTQTAPAAPTGVTATAGNGSATVSWTAPANGGSPITSYTITPYIGTTAQTTTTITGTPPATTISITGLTNGTAYTFKVTATNGVGTSPASSASNTVTPTAPTAPTAPTGVTATAGNGSATVSWTAPANGGSPITSYTITPYIGTTAQTTTTITGTPPATNANITGLTNGTTYTFKVTATNGVGTSPASSASNAVTPAAPTAPSAPTGVTATPGNGSASVSWTAPNNGGSTITSYTITPYIGTTAQTTTTINGTPPATNATIIGLTNGTAYTFTVTATNTAGTSPASTPSTAVTPTAPATPPAAPTAVTATAGNGSATVSWTAPNNGGSTITSYTITPYIGTTAQTTTTISGSPPSTTAVVGGLTNGTTYTFTVTATNTVGTSPASTPSAAVTPAATTPGAPTGVTATAGNGSATVSWTAPNNGGSTITSYTITPYIGTTAQTTTTISGSPPSTTAVVGGLTNGTTYTFTVTASNTVGTSPASSPSGAVTPVACPCSIWSASASPAVASVNDTNAVELGVKFRTDTPGYISGIRFYKGSANTGTHVGSLWTSTGTNLASATFSGETATGWQQVTFTTPIQITAGTTYVASYFAPNGGYAATGAQFATVGVDNGPLHALANGVDGSNALYKYGASSFPTNSFNSTNYWVDVVFTTSAAADTTPPVISAVQAGSISSAGASINWTTDENSDSQVEYGPTTAYGSSTTVDPTLVKAHSQLISGLTASLLYHYRVKSRDAAGNLATSADGTFTTTAAATCPCSIWSASALPAVASVNDSNAVEVGVKFRSDTPGYISGIRFYKGSANTGTHVGSLWTSTGTNLASATFSGETATGWQQVTFTTPIQITAGTTYVASYFAPNGGYAATGAQFATVGVDNGPLHALANGVDGSNAVYNYGPTSFPTNSFNSTNYWVDVVFSTTAGP